MVMVGHIFQAGLFAVLFLAVLVPVAGIPIQITRTYDSRNKEAGDFGGVAGWNAGGVVAARRLPR